MRERSTCYSHFADKIESTKLRLPFHLTIYITTQNVPENGIIINLVAVIIMRNVVRCSAPRHLIITREYLFFHIHIHVFQVMSYDSILSLGALGLHRLVPTESLFSWGRWCACLRAGCVHGTQGTGIGDGEGVCVAITELGGRALGPDFL